jgi:hypothetical protein
MRFLLVCSTLVPVMIAACGGVSEYPAGSGDDDASTDASGVGSSSSGTDSGGPVLDSGTTVFDASHPHDAAGVDAGPVDGVCPKACTDEPTGVPPCKAPERSCDCPASEPAPTGCAPAPGLATVYCCAS